MADTKISALTDGSPLAATDDIPVARSGTNRRVRIDLSAYATAAQGALADSAQQPPAEGAFVDGDKTKLDGIETLADVTDTVAVEAAGALMDSEVTNLAAVKAFDAADYATAAQGALADTAVQPGDAVAVPAVVVTVSKTLALTDANTEQVVDSGSAVVLTIPTNAAVALPVGTKISALGIGAGSATATADTGVTLNGVSAGSAALTAQYSAAVLTKVGTDAWVLNGDHGAVA